MRLLTVRAFAVKVEGKRLPVSPFSGLLKGCKDHKTHRFENGGTNQIRKTGKREVVFRQPLPQTLYSIQQRFHFRFETFHSRRLSRWAALLGTLVFSEMILDGSREAKGID